MQTLRDGIRPLSLRDWLIASKLIEHDKAHWNMIMSTFGQVTPVLRIFDIAKAREFYLHWLGFAVDFEHRFEPALPLYMRVSRGAAILHLSEHHGDCSPGAKVLIETAGLAAYHAELAAKTYGYMRPSLERQPWGHTTMTVIDPFLNRIVFTEPTQDSITA